MSQPKPPKVPSVILVELKQLPSYSFRLGGSKWHVIVDGHIIAALPQGTIKENGRMVNNIALQVRRYRLRGEKN